jgi:hypothetical protein
MLEKIDLLTNPIWVVMLLLGLIACVPQGTPSVTPPPVVFDNHNQRQKITKNSGTDDKKTSTRSSKIAALVHQK